VSSLAEAQVRPDQVARTHWGDRLNLSYFHLFKRSPSAPESPIRSELFSEERLEQHAKTLATAQSVDVNQERSRPLARRLHENAKVLAESYRIIVGATHKHHAITPAARWLLESFHIVNEQIREIENDLPPGYYRLLPKLADGPLQGYPRVFGIAWAVVAHTDSAIEIHSLTRFLQAYQQVQPLTIGELWALAITLRITLVENLRRLAESIVGQLTESALADTLADRILGAVDNPEPASAVMKSLDQAPWSSAFAVELSQRLRDRDPDSTPALRWLDERLATEGTTTDQIVRQEVHDQGATDVTVRNVVTSMRLMSMINWQEFFESVSPVDITLRGASEFGAMDFPTRDLYRRAIEKLSRQSGHGEGHVAELAIAAAARAKGQHDSEAPAKRRQRDPGYYLIAEGRGAIEGELGCKVPFGSRLFRFSARLGIAGYAGMIAIVAVCILATLLLLVAHAGLGGWALVALGVVGFVPAADVATAIVNRLISQNVGGAPLPGMELRNGIPADLQTIVVMPIMLVTVATVKRQVEQLELHHLSNSDENCFFALLSDWRDSATEHDIGDQVLLDEAAAGIARLNAQYAAKGSCARFFLLHRRRLWNEGERMWIGWERKRGKLHELNRLLTGATDTTFIAIDDHPAALPAGIRYVITLDADTRMPIGTARRLVGKMAHPLNRPFFDSQTGVVVQGHGIMQPRVTPSLPIGSAGSLFERAFSGPNGLDPYAAAVSDVYQDLFGEGSYCGKGIYEIESFQATLEGQIPEDSVLSHDLLEGIFARAGLASDIELVEEFPSRYDVEAARQHRWVRGDWQLLPWIFGLGRTTGGGSQKVALPLLGRWKLLDNLRRSLSAPAAFLSLLIGWLQPLSAAEIWTGYIVLTIAVPPLLPAIAGIVPLRRGVSIRNHLRGLRSDFALGLVQSAFLITFLAHQSWLMIDAMARTLFRVCYSRQHLLEWVTASQAHDNVLSDPRGLGWQISECAGFLGLVGFVVYVSGQQTWALAAPLAALWILSPLVARWASRPPLNAGQLSIRPADALALRLVARSTWRFFEKFVTAEDNMLPPDNFQEDPVPVIAHRTSPTNIGLYLLSVVAARDFGWLGTLDLLARLEGTFRSMGKLERFRGHFYNWYDTSDLTTLDPRYVSSVDSGNLAGHLIVLANACHEFMKAPVETESWTSGLEDTLALVRESAQGPADTDGQVTHAGDARLNETLESLTVCLRNVPSKPSGVAQRLLQLQALADALVDSADARCPVRLGGLEPETLVWAKAFQEQILAHQRDADCLLPWATLLNRESLAGSEILAVLDVMPTLDRLADHCSHALQVIERHPRDDMSQDLAALATAFEASIAGAHATLDRLAAIADLAKALFTGMEFGFLFDADRQLLSIGYRGAEGALDSNVYDLLASEARLASYIAIAKGDLPAKHWFRLGRTLTPIDRGSALLSWSGSMFEYLMPSLVMRAPDASLLAQTNRLVVSRQEKYGAGLGVPWGMSESEYNARDIEHTYQYSSFGVPDLGYKRGLGENTVIAPYASGLASMIDPAAAARNFKRMADIGACGIYGWYEALDYTRARMPEGSKVVIIRAYMAHHQGMTIVGIANAVQSGRMRARFHAEPMMRASELLLQERPPRDVALAKTYPEEALAAAQVVSLTPDAPRTYGSAHSRFPLTHLLSNGRFSTMVTGAGSGYARWRDIAITRWREDVTCDNWGAYVFLRDLRSGEVWSASYEPTAVKPDSYEVTFSEDRAEILRRDGDVTTTLEIMVSPEDDAEVRRISITNLGTGTLDIELTSYAEIALARQADDVAHPAFAKLFVETEFVPEMGVILATRRQRSPSDPTVWAAHLAVVEGESFGDVQFETDRARFIGRGQTTRSPLAMNDGWPLSNTAGCVLDPIFSLRRHVRIPPRATVSVAFWTLAASSREGALVLADKHHDANAYQRARTLSWTQAQMQLRHLGITTGESHLFQRLANHVLYCDGALRPPAEVIKQGAQKASVLWETGISGDRPIVLVRAKDDRHIELVRQLLRAHEYWRLKQLAVDLVILNERGSSYVQDLQISLEALVRMNRSMPSMDGEDPRGAVFTLRADLVSAEIQDLLHACARAVLYGDRGSLADQLNRASDFRPASTPRARRAAVLDRPQSPSPLPKMEFFNGLGGFTKNGSEYLTVLQGATHTPAPWLNVVANPSFGFQVSADGSGFTWSVNSQQNQLTPWSNDPVGDPAGEALYVRDEDTGELWGPTALPRRETSAPYLARHGQGYSQFEHVSHDIALEYLQFVPVDDPIKISRLKIVNRSDRRRRLSITAYVEWVLGVRGGAAAPLVVTEIDPATGAIFAQNPWNNSFGGRVAFVDLLGRQTAWTCDRAEFLGRDGAMSSPLALTPGAVLSKRVGAGLDPCSALQTEIRLEPLGSTEIVFLLGQSATKEEAQSLVVKYRRADLDETFAAVALQWDETLGVVQVKTPDRALDILLNRWLPYQTLACRVWARTAFYQASGAYGFRDQLQDVMALCVSRPEIAREHLLRAAARQFLEGDVQHWWLPESGKGIRTRITDDRGWLAYVVAHYVEVTGDRGALDESVPFLEGPVLKKGEHDAFFAPTISNTSATLFEHCAQALDKSLETGAHGLPLIGAGDWNDGMDRIGQEGKGESVWLGWFLITTLDSFTTLAEERHDLARAQNWRRHAKSLAASLNDEAWDGDWYRRAYFDDGSPLGSVANDQCRIDSIAQSWAVISGAAQPAHAARAMAALDKYLVRRDQQLSLLFTPPFNNPTHDPGYIKGYPPGVRENGGQYTHGAVWAALAFAILGDGDKATELLSMLNPIHHTDSPNGVQRYKVEPYVACADVYSEPPHVGRGGWTWYTGSAGWMYRVALEYILGFRLRGANLALDPCIPHDWPSFEITFRYRSARYEIAIDNPRRVCRGVVSISLDDKVMATEEKVLVPLVDDGATHRVRVVLG
jgi:cyclic beta-1,2-glucan synthetase